MSTPHGPMPDPSYSIRRASPADLEAVARIWHEGWNDGHLGHVPAGILPYRQAEHFASRARERIGTMLVVEAAGRIVGFVVVKEDEIEQLFVDRDARGTGAARLLLQAGEEEIRRAGHRRAWLAVVGGNARARAFYAREGWRDTGPFIYMAETPVGPFPVPSHRCERDLIEA